MKKPLLKYLRLALDVVGALSIIGLAILAVLVANQFFWQKPEIDRLTPQKAIFVLNWGNIGDKSKIEKILHSYESPRSFTGDHIDAYSIKITGFPESVLIKEQIPGQKIWLQGPITEPILKDAVELACLFADGDGLKWFPQANELNSDRFYLSFRTVYLHNQQVTAIQLIAYDRKEKILYYADVKT